LNHERSGVYAAMLSVVVLIGVFLALNPSMTKSSTNSESRPSSLTASQSPQSNSTDSSVDGLRVVDANVTVYGEPAFIGRCEAIAANCPPFGMNASLSVELIIYNDAYYYVHNDTVISGGVLTETHTDSTGGLNVTTVTEEQLTVTYTAWFTNSTLYCVSPGFETAPTCPGQP
jgi:hypothetical protein